MIDKDRLADGLYLLTKGVRDCLEMSIVGTPEEINDQLCDIESLATRNDYHVLAFKIKDKELESEGKEYHMVFVCKYQYQRVLLTKLFNEIKPHSFIYEYIMGTLLGYSAASMEEFLMKHCTDHMIGKEYYDTDAEEKKVEYPNEQLSEFDKDAWQVLTTLNDNCTTDSDKINMITDLLYTDTEDSRAKGLKHDLAGVMPDRNKPDFSSCIKVLEKYFGVDNEGEETDSSSVEDANNKKLKEVFAELNNYFSKDNKEKPAVKQYFGRAAGLYLILDQKLFSKRSRLTHIKNFIDETPPQTFLEMELFVNIESIYYDKSLSIDGTLEAVNNALHRYLFSKKKVINGKIIPKRKKSDIVIDTIMNRSGGDKKRLNIKEYFGRAAGLYSFLNLAASLTPNTLPEDEQLDHIKKFLELNPPKTFPEILIHNNIKSVLNKSLSKEIKISNIKSILHTYLFSKKNIIYREETKQKDTTNESVDPYLQAVKQLYDDLRNANSDDEFISILNKFLEKDACYKVHKNFQQSLQWIIENKYGKEKSFSNNVLYRIKTFLAIGV